MADARFISRRALAVRWSVSVRSLLNWEASGALPRPRRLGGVLRYDLAEIEKFEVGGVPRERVEMPGAVAAVAG